MEIDRRQLLRYAAAGAAMSYPGRAPATALEEGSEPTDTGAFDPGVHGFGFSNWEGDTGTGRGGAEFDYEPGDVTEGDVREAIRESWTSALSEAKESLMTRLVYAWIGSNAATNGHCYGMTFAADEYFQAPEELPAGVETASDIPRPTGPFDDVGHRIRRLQTSQLLRAEPYWFALFGMRWGLADHQESARLLVEALESSGTAGISLDGESNPHQVLVYGYENTGGLTEFSIYDPTHSAAEHEDPANRWTLSVDRETGEVVEIADGYDTFLYHDPEMDETVLDSIVGGADRVLGELSDAVFLGLETPGDLALDVPDDALVDRPDAEFADPDGGPYDESALVLGSLDELSVSLEGESGAEYSLEVLGLRDDTLVFEDVVTDVLAEGSARLQLSTDEAGEFVVETIEEAAEEAGEAAEEAAEDVEDANGSTPRERLGVLVATGTAAGLGAAYWMLGRRGGGEDDS